MIAKSYARIHWQNLANFGVLAVEFTDPADYDRVEAGDELSVHGLPDTLGSRAEFTVHDQAKDRDYTVRHRLSSGRSPWCWPAARSPWSAASGQPRRAARMPALERHVPDPGMISLDIMRRPR